MEKMFFVSRKLEFFASHNLEGRPIHIHRFALNITFSGKRADFTKNYSRTLLINYHDIDKLWKSEIRPKLIDSSQQITISNSSCENLAEWIFNEIDVCMRSLLPVKLHAVEVNDGDVTATVMRNHE